MQLRFKLVDFNIAVTSEINLHDVLIKQNKNKKTHPISSD